MKDHMSKKRAYLRSDAWYGRGTTVWDCIVDKLIGKNAKLLKGRGRYNRDQLYTLVCEYLTAMMCMEIQVNTMQTPTYNREIVGKMRKQWGTVLLKRWHGAKHSSELNTKRTFCDVTSDIRRWQDSNCSNHITMRMIITLVWGQYKSHIIENIIEPVLLRRRHRRHVQQLQPKPKPQPPQPPPPQLPLSPPIFF